MAWDVDMVEIWNATTAQALPDSAVATATSLEPMLAKHQKPYLFCTNPRRFSFLIVTVWGLSTKEALTYQCVPGHAYHPPDMPRNVRIQRQKQLGLQPATCVRAIYN